MSKYNVGDVIKLRDDLEVGEEYGAVDFLYSMKTLKNKALRIDSIDTEDDECVVYEIDGWWISEEMIEGLLWEDCKEKQDKTKLIDVLNMIAKGELKAGTRVIYGKEEYIYDADEDDLLDKGGYSMCYWLHMKDLNDEVELIEPPCEHEWENYETHRIGEGLIKKGKRCNKCGLEEVTEECVPDERNTLEPSKIAEIQSPETYGGITYHIIDKLNEVIRKVNAQTEVILAHRKDIDEIKEQLDY